MRVLFLTALLSLSPYIYTYSVHKNVKTRYYEIKTIPEPGLSPTTTIPVTEYIDPITPQPTGLTTQTVISSDYYGYTYIDIQVPSEGVQSKTLPDEEVVRVTYSRCTFSTEGYYYNDKYYESTYFALPESTATVIVTVPGEAVRPVSVSTGTGSSFSISLDPIQYASLSHGNQPTNCVTATTSVDYRGVCRGLAPGETIGTVCGSLNPCCYDCYAETPHCYWPCTTRTDTADPQPTLYRCANGVAYSSNGAVSVDPLLTMPSAKGTITSFSNGSPVVPMPTSSSTGGAEAGPGVSRVKGWSRCLGVAVAGVLVL